MAHTRETTCAHHLEHQQQTQGVLLPSRGPSSATAAKLGRLPYAVTYLAGLAELSILGQAAAARCQQHMHTTSTCSKQTHKADKKHSFSSW